MDSPTLSKAFDQTGLAWITHDVGGQNFDLEREKESCSKAYGRAKITSVAASSEGVTGSVCLGLHELWDGTNREHFYFDQGRCFKFDASARHLSMICDTASTIFATDNVDLYSIIQYGNYMVFADRAEHTPYKIDHNDTALTKLIASGTEYKFRYLMNFTNRIIGLYSDQTNGDIDIRYTNALAETTFPAANQLYKQGDPISGGIQLGHNTAFVLGQGDIYRMDYYPTATPVYTLVRVIKGWGTTAPSSLVSDGIAIYFYDQKKGFCRFDGSTEPEIISEIYEKMTSRIPIAYDNLIDSLWIPFRNEIAWNIPVDDDTRPSKIIYYNRKTKQWRHENKIASRLDAWKTFSNYTWNDLILETDDVWPTAKSWAYYTSESHKVVFGGRDGNIYTSTSEGDSGSNWEAYRIEPVLPFPGNGHRVTRILEVWADIAEKQSHSLDFYWRGGDTVGELEQESWESLGSISMDSPDDAVLYINKWARLHQVKWGTDLKSEPYSVPELRFGFVSEGIY